MNTRVYQGSLNFMAMLQESKEALENKLMLNMMSRIEMEPSVSQRVLSAQLGVAIGLVNTYIKRCIQKGLIKVQQIPSRRYAYYLTPKGFVEKTKLTAEYLTSSFQFVRDTQKALPAIYQHCLVNHWHRLILAGTGDLSEIAIQVFSKPNMEIHLAKISDFPVEIEFDAVIITDVDNPQKTFDTLCQYVSKDRILTLPFLYISRHIKIIEQDKP